MIKAIIEFAHLIQILIAMQYNISTFNIVMMITSFSLSQMAIMFMKIDTNCDGTVDWVSLPATSHHADAISIMSSDDSVTLRVAYPCVEIHTSITVI